MRKPLGISVSIDPKDLPDSFKAIFDPSLVVETYDTLPFSNSQYPYIEKSMGGFIVQQGNINGIGGAEEDLGVYLYKPTEKTFTKLADSPNGTYWSPFCVVDSTLFYVGGRLSSGAFSHKTYTLDLLNPSGGWTELPATVSRNIWSGRLHHYNGYLYLYGCNENAGGYMPGIYKLSVRSPHQWEYLDIDFNRKITHTAGAVDELLIIGNYNTYGSATFGKQYNVSTGELSLLPGAHILDSFPYCGDRGVMYMNTGKALLIQDKESTPHVNMKFKSAPFSGAINAHSAVQREYMYSLYGTKVYRTRIYQS